MAWLARRAPKTPSTEGKPFCTTIGAKFVDDVEPVLHALGRRGAWSVIQTLRSSTKAISLRGLARRANVPLSSVQRIIDEWETLGAVDRIRPGRDTQVRWRPGPLAAWLEALSPPDVPHATLAAFVAGYRGPGRVRRWRLPGAAVLPVRIVVLTPEEEPALDAVGPALDAVRRAGWPAPVVAVHDPAALDATDPVAAAMLNDQ